MVGRSDVAMDRTERDDTVSSTLFETLGALVDDRWRQAHRDEDAFPDIAAQALEELSPAAQMHGMTPARWLLRTPLLPRQIGGNGFGQPPITLFASDRFYIEALYWIDGTTAIHQHQFAGAFQVLAGSSIHSQFQFGISDRISQLILRGRLGLTSMELLRPGQVRKITRGAGFIHSLFHLERPSVTVVVRTVGSNHGEPQYEYLKPGLARDPFFKPDGLARRQMTLRLFAEVGGAEFWPRLEEAVVASDSHEALALVLDATAPILLQDWDRFLELTNRIAPRHPALAAVLPSVLAEHQRQMRIIRLRSRIRHPDHRFFLALLLNAPTRELAIAMVAARHPERDPVDLMTEWLAELGGSRDDGGPGVPLIGVPVDDEGSLQIFRGLLLGLSPDDVVAHLNKEFRPEDVAGSRDDIARLCSAFERSDLFSPLFATSTA